MKDMCAISMNIDTLNFFAVDIATNMIALIYYETTLATVRRQACKCRSKESGPDNQIIILLIVHLACHF
jgi:hypothetical protein